MRKLNVILLLSTVCFFISCNKTMYPQFSYFKSENPWKDAFKDQVFFSSLRESYKDEQTIFQSIEKKDAFNPYDGLSADALNKARNLGIQLVKEMPPPAMCEGCTKGQNYYMANALHYYKSAQLDSIANSEYKKFMKNEKE